MAVQLSRFEYELWKGENEMENKPNDGIVYSTGECAAQKFDPLSKEKLFEMVGKPVFVVGMAPEVGWKVIRSILILKDRIEIAFTDNDIASYNLDFLKCYDREVPEIKLSDFISGDIPDPDTLELIRHFAQSRKQIR